MPQLEESMREVYGKTLVELGRKILTSWCWTPTWPSPPKLTCSARPIPTVFRCRYRRGEHDWHRRRSRRDG